MTFHMKRCATFNNLWKSCTDKKQTMRKTPDPRQSCKTAFLQISLLYTTFKFILFLLTAIDMPIELMALNVTPQGALLRWTPPLSNVDNYVLTLTHSQGKYNNEKSMRERGNSKRESMSKQTKWEKSEAEKGNNRQRVWRKQRNLRLAQN